MTRCPICGGQMEPELAACWPCYRLTNRLTPGTYTTSAGRTVILTRAQVDRADAARLRRIGGAA